VWKGQVVISKIMGASVIVFGVKENPVLMTIYVKVNITATLKRTSAEEGWIGVRVVNTGMNVLTDLPACQIVEVIICVVLYQIWINPVWINAKVGSYARMLLLRAYASLLSVGS
jgi:hypothetical protein